MNAKQRAFVTEYLVDLNATQAAKRAGYDSHSAYSQGQRLLKNDEVKQAVDATMKDRAQRTTLTQDYVIQRLMVIAEQSMSGDKPDYKSALRSLELLGKHIGLFTPTKEQGLPDVDFAVRCQIRRLLLERDTQQKTVIGDNGHNLPTERSF